MVKKRIEVAVGVVIKGIKVLVGQRLVQDLYFQKWEFPGGKLESDEEPIEALKRELYEELRIEIISAKPLIILEHDYPDRHVRLFVYEVDQYSGEPIGAEGQALRWIDPSECHGLDFLEANKPIVHAVQLPSLMFITDIEKYGLNKTVEAITTKDKKYNSNFIIQLREPKASLQQLCEYLRIIRQETNSSFIFLNGNVRQAHDLGFDGVQINRHHSKLYSTRSELPDFWIGASCHDIDELRHAEKFADYVLLSPVKKTSSHLEKKGLGWEKFKNLTCAVKIPCYALGGLSLEEIDIARRHGAQGVAAISSVWSG